MSRSRTLYVSIKVDTAQLDELRAHLTEMRAARTLVERMSEAAAQFAENMDAVRRALEAGPAEVAALAEQARALELRTAQPPALTADPAQPCGREVDWVLGGPDATTFVAVRKTTGEVVRYLYIGTHASCATAAQAAEADPRPEGEGR